MESSDAVGQIRRRQRRHKLKRKNRGVTTARLHRSADPIDKGEKIERNGDTEAQSTMMFEVVMRPPE